MSVAYYDFLSHETTIQGQPAVFYSRPALGDLAEQVTSALLLDEWVRLSPTARVLCMHCGTGLVGLVVARQAPAARITLVDSHAVAVETARRTTQANQIASTEILLGDCAQPVFGRPFDHVLAHLPKGRAVWQQTILDAAQLLDEDGTFYLAGANRSGIKSAAKYVERVFGHVNVLGFRGGCRILSATKPTMPDTAGGYPEDYYALRRAQTKVGDKTLVYATRPGLFSWKALDQGTRLLLETLCARPLRENDRVWDVGCGSGLLTLLAAQQANRGQVVATDVDWRAIQATLETAALNELANVEVVLSDCAEALRGQSFSAVVTNPPFHQARTTTYAIAEQIVQEAARLLDPGGRLYLVANSFLRYKPMIESAFGQAQLLAETGGFKIWHAIRE
jgi:16S rRNA (guanine1207-N2)-methyltransferase